VDFFCWSFFEIQWLKYVLISRLNIFNRKKRQKCTYVSDAHRKKTLSVPRAIPVVPRDICIQMGSDICNRPKISDADMVVGYKMKAMDSMARWSWSTVELISTHSAAPIGPPLSLGCWIGCIADHTCFLLPGYFRGRISGSPEYPW
jgi:hypothetical protein